VKRLLQLNDSYASGLLMQIRNFQCGGNGLACFANSPLVHHCQTKRHGARREENIVQCIGMHEFAVQTECEAIGKQHAVLRWVLHDN
jgi:hypothetical protein